MSAKSFWDYAQQAPSKLGLVSPEGEEFSRGELFSESNRLVRGLREQGLAAGDVVAVCMPNRKELLSLSLATFQAGMYLVPINWHLAAAEVAYILSDCGAKIFIADERIDNVASMAVEEASLEHRSCFCIGNIEGFRPFDELVWDYSDQLPEDRSAGAVMNYTSGTTGKPKGVQRPLAGLDPETAAQLATGLLQILGSKPEDDNVNITCSPLYHTAVLVWANASLHLGHPVVLMDKWDAEDMLRLIEKYRVTTSHMVPTQLTRLLKLPESVRNRYDCSSTRRMVHAAAPCPPDIKRGMIEWWGNSIYEYYAASEGGGTIVSPQEWLQHPGTVGKPWPNADIRIFNDDGEEMPTGEQGTVYMRLSERADFEYKGDTDKTRANRIDNYFTVGDVGYLNDEGYLFLCDRKIDMIISGGANIYPAEIENVLILHPQVADCAVFGIPHEDWGEEIKAVVQLADGATEDDNTTATLLDFLATRLAKMKLPKSIDYLPELPRDPNGKLFKRRLRDPYWKDQKQKV
ncbi:acyl-CoA synthetase [Pseudomaricurvus alkylphenolicus]|uniref:acyl-CoA synthetase n=1 Tax=Pseudomaricurvus alkylphenolicus TaxID=1306991 RepID=UPI0014237F6C|nr:acyl-CoA synthetase [Pseudomaricurvus alkylphenolicus]NIB38954.1 acyl-CoA synthetase [Pseudomaricurvus alkylphenolicus]